MLTASAALAIFVYGLTSPLLGVLLPTYALSLSQKADLGLANALGLMTASIAAGPFADLKGNKLALILGLCLLAVALLAAPLATGYPALTCVYLALGFGGGVVVTAANSLTSRAAGSTRAAKLNFLNLFFGLGGIVTTAIADIALTPRTFCYTVAGLAALALLLSATFHLPAPLEHSPESGSGSAAPKILGQTSLLLLLSLLSFFYFACEVGIWNWLRTYLLTAGFSPTSAARAVSYGFASGFLVGRLAAARLLRKLSPVPVLLTAGILTAITTAAILRLASPTAITIFVFCAGLAMAPVFPTTLALIGDNIPRGSATAMGLAITSGWSGSALSSIAIGSLVACYSLRNSLLLIPACASSMVLVTTVLKYRLRPRNSPHARETA